MKAPLGPICLLFAGLLAGPAPAQDTQPSAENQAAAETATTNAPAATNTAPGVKPERGSPSSTRFGRCRSSRASCPRKGRRRDQRGQPIEDQQSRWP